jgi:hypothetical protein
MTWLYLNGNECEMKELCWWEKRRALQLAENEWARKELTVLIRLTQWRFNVKWIRNEVNGLAEQWRKRHRTGMPATGLQLLLQVAGGPSGDQVSVVIVVVVVVAAVDASASRVVGVTSQRINVQPEQ